MDYFDFLYDVKTMVYSWDIGKQRKTKEKNKVENGYCIDIACIIKML